MANIINLATEANQEKIMKMLPSQNGVAFSPVMRKRILFMENQIITTGVFSIKKDEEYIYTLSDKNIKKYSISNLSSTNATFTIDSNVTLKDIFLKDNFLITGGLIKVGSYYQIIIYKLNKDDLSIIQQKQYAVTSSMSRNDGCTFFVNDNYACLTCVATAVELPIFDLETLNFIKNPFNGKVAHLPVSIYGNNDYIIAANSNQTISAYSFTDNRVFAQNTADNNIGNIHAFTSLNNDLYFLSDTGIFKYSSSTWQRIASISLFSKLQFISDNEFYILDTNNKIYKYDVNLLKDGNFIIDADILTTDTKKVLVDSLDSPIYFLGSQGDITKAKNLYSIMGYERIDE